MNAAFLLNGRTGMGTAALFAAVGLGLTGAQTPTMAAPMGPSELAKLAAAGGVDALQQMLDARSPGVRMPGALTQTKERRAYSLREAFGPKERVLSEGRTRPVVPGSPAAAPINEPLTLTGPDLFTPVGGPGVVAGGEPQIASLTPVPGIGGNPGGGFSPIVVGGGGGGTGGGGGGGGSGGGGTTPGVGNAVPEPATWASLLIGFFAIGIGMRGATASKRVRWRIAS